VKRERLFLIREFMSMKFKTQDVVPENPLLNTVEQQRSRSHPIRKMYARITVICFG
jgi:ribosomal protein L31E